MRRLVGSTNVATGTGVAQLAGGAVDELLQAPPMLEIAEASVRSQSVR